MTITVGGSAITFSNGTTQTTAASTFTPAYGAVGCVVSAASTNYSGQGGSAGSYANPGVTVAGSTLRMGYSGPFFASINFSQGDNYNPGLVGTWVSCSRFFYYYDSSYNTRVVYVALWMRIS